MKTSIAVLITYHNEQRLLTRCVESLLKQPAPPDEIWVYDDASEIPATAFLPPEIHSRVVRGTSNKGPSFGRNFLLEKATSTFVHFHDADDWFFPEWCESVRDVARTGADAVFTELSSFVNGRLAKEGVIGLPERFAQSADHVRFVIHHAILPAAGTYRRQLVAALGGYREDVWQSEDWDFHVRLALRHPRVAAICRPLVGIDVRPESRSHKRAEVWSSQLQSIALLETEVPPEFHGDLAEAAAHASGELYRLGHHADAARGFELAAHLGRPTFDGRPAMYRVLASLISPLFAERVAGSYRRLLPGRLRSMMRRNSTGGFAACA